MRIQLQIIVNLVISHANFVLALQVKIALIYNYWLNKSAKIKLLSLEMKPLLYSQLIKPMIRLRNCLDNI